ncbi:MFS transporter [Viridibacillus sp. NPDC096237]|uniref:MFS transporter n=1 Tax=Viridibacillus sp. NPDC096237 TaxID=3390721 RepID=UPI003D02863E
MNQLYLLKNKNFSLLYFSTLISTLGGQIYTFILPLFIYDLSKSALAMSTMRMVDFLPNVLLGMLAGAIVDRVNRRWMLQYTSLIQAILSSILVIIILLDIVQLWHLYLLGFLLSTVGYTFGNAKHSIIPQLFDKKWMTEIEAKFSLIGTIVSIIGPSIAGFLLVWFAYEWLFLIYTICLVIIWISYFFIDPVSTPKRNKSQSLIEDMKEGIVELFGNKQLLSPTLTILFINFATSLVIGVLVFYVVDELGASTSEVGWMYSISAIGGIIGAKAIQPLRNKWRRGQIFVTMLAVDAVALLLFFFANSWWQLGILLAFRTFTSVIINIIYLAIRQESTPNHLLGRVAGTSSMFMKLVLPLGLFIAGLWAEWLPIPYLFILSSIIICVLVITLLRGDFKNTK